MTQDEFTGVWNAFHPTDRDTIPLVEVSDLESQEDRTLIWGYTINRDSFHVYLHGGVIHRTIRNSYLNEQPEGYPDVSFPNGISFGDAIPDKRIYPEASDREFLMVLHAIDPERVKSLPFTTFDLGREVKKFYGQVRPEHAPSSPTP